MRIVLSLGGNLGDTNIAFSTAIVRLEEEGVCDICKSSIFKTKPINCPENSPDYQNMAITGSWYHSPNELLVLCKKLEQELGRDKTYIRNSPRPLDIDIILFGDEIIKTDNLTVPHIEAHRRLFVLEPLAQIAPTLIFPTFQKRVDELLKECVISFKVLSISKMKANLNFSEQVKQLPIESQERKLKYKNEKSAWASLCAEKICRSMLLDKYDDNVANQKFDIGKNGKPYFRDKIDINFNVSHSSQFATCAISPYELGIDIEDANRKANNFAQIAKRFYSSSENAFVEEYGKEGFLKIWTMKEAFVKSIGTGISIPLNQFSVPLESNQTIINNQQFFFHYVKTKQYHLSICSKVDLNVIKQNN